MLAGRAAIVTGAGRGVGAAAARLLAAHGARVVVNDLDPAPAASTAAALASSGGEAFAFPGSVMDAGFPDALVAACVERYGAPHVLVNNAGFLFDAMLHKMSDEQWAAIVHCHLTAPFQLVRAAAGPMREAAKAEMERTGRPADRSIVNVSSTSGLHGNVGQANYAAAKAGIIGLTKTIAKEFGPLGIRANAVAFGMIDTRMTSAFREEETVVVGGTPVSQGLPKHVAQMWQSEEMLRAAVPLCRKGTPEEAAGGILFLASPLATYVTGHTLEVTGGMGI
ncbi:hypothetical protein AB1Y20_006634 [Prymnesium parvum]|uniref:3-oxoacyl-[acyl-carrier-protein] reductase n=1 Tax=Prymnesium parvum TaxID=97485 RepID=A0AB34J0W3_PRYPA